MKSDVSAARVPFFDYSSLYRVHLSAVETAMRSVNERGAFILQEEVFAFETELARFLGLKHAIGVGNCTDGLELLLRASEIGPGDEVLVPAHTFVASAGAVIAAGGTVRPVEVGDDHMLDPDLLEAQASDRTRAVIAVSLNGTPARLDEVLQVTQSHGWVLVEDAAQAVGARLDGKPTGSFGVGAALSFYPAKTLGAFGDAGAVVTNSDELAEKIRQLRDHGRDLDGVVRRWGRNSRLDTLQAAVLRVFLAQYQQSIAHRRRAASRYIENLGDIGTLRLPPHPDADPRRYIIAQNFEVEADRRNELREYLASNGIGTALPWGGYAFHEFPELGLNYSLPKTEYLMRRLILLPLHQFITDDQIDIVCRAVRDFYSRG